MNDNISKQLLKKVNKKRGFRAFGIWGDIEETDCEKCKNSKWGCKLHHECPECRITQYKGVY